MSESIRTTVVGSYPVPGWLLGQPSEQALDDATRVVFQTQRLAGIELVADGELYRFDANHPETNGMIDYFVGPMENIRTELSRADRRLAAERSDLGFRTRPAGVVVGPVGEGTLDLVSAYQRVRQFTDQPLKFTLTSPYMLAKTLLDTYYGELESLSLALAEVLAAQVREIDADVVQVDEANLTGHPEDAGWVAAVLNRLFFEIPGTPALHLCFGNYGGQSIQQGHWEALIDFLNQLHIDHVVGEFAFRGSEELHHFTALRPDIGLGLGVVDIKTTVVESAETVARRIQEAVDIVGFERIRYVHPDCGFWMLPRSVADAKMRAVAAGRDLFLGVVPG